MQDSTLSQRWAQRLAALRDSNPMGDELYQEGMARSRRSSDDAESQLLSSLAAGRASASAGPTGPSAADSSGIGGNADSWIRDAMRITGVDASWGPGLRRRMMQESGGRNIPQGIRDVNTRKGTPAFGPMQVIQPTFRSNAMPGYGDWQNPLHNTIASIRYIQRRYRHPDRLPRGGY